MPILSFLNFIRPKKLKYDKQIIFSLQHLNPREFGFPRKGGTSLGLQQRAQQRDLPSFPIYPAPEHKGNSAAIPMWDLTNKSRVYIVGHGSPGDNKISGETADGRNNTWNVAELADLIQSKYKHNPKSKSQLHVSLVACNGGMNGLYGEPSIAEQLCIELHKRGIAAKVTGRMGYVERYKGEEEYRKLVGSDLAGQEVDKKSSKQSFSIGPDGKVIRTLGKVPSPARELNRMQLNTLSNFMHLQHPQGTPWSHDAKYGQHIASHALNLEAAQKLQRKIMMENMGFNESTCFIAQSESSPGFYRVLVNKPKIEESLYLQVQYLQKSIDEHISKIAKDCKFIHETVAEIKRLQKTLQAPSGDKATIERQIKKLQNKLEEKKSDMEKDLFGLQALKANITQQRSLLIQFTRNYTQLSPIDAERANQSIKLQSEAEVKLLRNIDAVNKQASSALALATPKEKQQLQYTTLPSEIPGHHFQIPTVDPMKRPLPMTPSSVEQEPSPDSSKKRKTGPG